MLQSLNQIDKFFVKQVFEMAELFSFESRNKYRILDERGQEMAFAAEQQKGFLGFLLRQFLGHWRTFTLHFYDQRRQEFMIAEHPFRWFFQRLEVREMNQRLIGVIERQFSLFTKRFTVLDGDGHVLFEVASPLWKIWTFPFMRRGKEQARISKKWSGVGFEIFTDRDNFLVEYLNPQLTLDERALVLAAALYVDLLFFENKAN